MTIQTSARESLVELSARDIARRIVEGSLTCEDLVKAYLDRIEARERTVHAWQFIDPDRVIAQARQLDRTSRRGPLHGVPLGVKDVIDTADYPTGYGSEIYCGHKAPWDATCVAKARDAGALIMGKTVSTEFAFVAPAKTTNPHNKDHTPGGSSSGSAAAVASQMVPLALGTQTAGSIIRPASFCGIVGYKPTFGLIDRTGVKTLATSFDTVGLFARNVLDAAFLTSVLSGRRLEISASQTAPRIGFYPASSWHAASSDVMAAIDSVKAAMVRLGATIRNVAEPTWAAQLPELQQSVMDWDVTQALSFEVLNHEKGLAEKTRMNLRERRSRSDPEKYDAALIEIRTARARLDQMFDDCDVLLTPAAPGEAPRGLQSTGDSIFNRPWTMLHVPCVTIPVTRGANGLPVGVQFVGKIGSDETTLSAALFLERALAVLN